MGNNPALMRWDVATGGYIDIVARAEHPIVVYPSEAVMKAAAPTLPHALGYAAAENKWGVWTGPAGPGQQGSWSINEYWSTTRGNMVWQQQRYQQNAIVYYAPTNSFYRATQGVPDTILNPTDAGSAAYWQQIGGSGGGATGGSLVFWGQGEFDAADVRPSNNWGMPAGTFPQNIQPQNGDVYYDTLSGMIVKFTVTTNPPTNSISDNSDRSTFTKIGDMSVGVVAGRQNILTFAEDGVAQGYNKNQYYSFRVPTDFKVTAETAGNVEEWDGPLAYGNGIAGAVLGSTIIVTETGGAAVPAGASGAPLDGRFWAENSGFVYTNLPWLNGRDIDGNEYIDGWLVVPSLTPGSQYDVKPFAVPTAGHFVNERFEGGTHWIIWSGDDTADHGGWATVKDIGQNPVPWTLGTPNPRPQPDDIAGQVTWGTVRHFDIQIPAGVNDDDVRSLLTGFSQETQLIRCEIRDSRPDGSVYEFDIMISQGVTPLLSPIAAIANNSVLKEINIKTTSSSTSLLVKLKSSARSHTLHITLTSNDRHLDVIQPHWAGYTMPSNPSINAEKNYPDTAELEAELVAASASADIQVPQWFTRASIQRAGNQTSFSLGVKPKRFLRATFMAKGGPATDTWPQVIAQLNGSWIDWSAHSRSDVIVRHQKGGQTLIAEVNNSMAADNTGLYASGPIETAYENTCQVEITFYKEHTLIEATSDYCDKATGEFMTYKTTVVYRESWQDQMNYIGYKNVGRNFEYQEAYIQWE
jgi:hypothetical protein